jgi:hypothetical protein
LTSQSTRPTLKWSAINAIDNRKIELSATSDLPHKKSLCELNVGKLSVWVEIDSLNIMGLMQLAWLWSEQFAIFVKLGFAIRNAVSNSMHVVAL